MISNLADLLRPHDLAELDQAILEHRPLFLRGGQPEAFQALLPWEEIAGLVTIDRLHKGHVRVIRQGRDLPLEMYTHPPRPTHGRRLAMDRFHDLCRQGVSLVVNSINQWVPRIAAMNAMVERHLQAPVFTNAYVTFERQSAFPIHWDPQNVLILQVHGRKRWALFGQPYRMPHRLSDSFSSPGPVASDAPAWERVMEPGDILYVPRGEVHRTEVAGPNSVHLTVTIVPPRADAVMGWLLERAMETEEVLRRDITPLGGVEARREQATQLRAALHRLVDGLDLDGFLADANRQRDPVETTNLGTFPLVTTDVHVAPTLRRPTPLPEEDAGVRAGSLQCRLTMDERAVLLLLMERGGLSYKDMAGALPHIAPETLETALAGLARKSLVFVFPD